MSPTRVTSPTAGLSTRPPSPRRTVCAADPHVRRTHRSAACRAISAPRLPCLSEANDRAKDVWILKDSPGVPLNADRPWYT